MWATEDDLGGTGTAGVPSRPPFRGRLVGPVVKGMARE